MSSLGKKKTTTSYRDYYFRRTVTKGQWELSEHILICMTVRHLFRSRELTTMLNRLGHSETYRFTQELETTIAKVFQGSSSLLSTQIVVNPAATQIVVNPAAIAKALQESSNRLSTQIVVNPAATQIVVNPAAIAKALQESSNRLSTQIVVNPAATQIVVNPVAIAKALQESSNSLSTQIVVTLRPLPKH